MSLDPALAEDDYCYVTTVGRVSGTPHEIEIWFGLRGESLYLLAGNGAASDWVRNARRHPRVRVRIRDRTYHAIARTSLPPEEDAEARRLLVEKYQPRYSGDLASWGRTALPVALDVEDNG